MPLNWFEKLFGFKETSPDQVRNNLILGARSIQSRVNGKAYQFGYLEIPTLEELRKAINKEELKSETCQLSEVIGDVQLFHQLPENAGALFQAASQFNLLEMINPNVSPEEGIGIYEYDLTQGPACAIACGAGTVYRNYFVEVKGQIGQTSAHQIDCLQSIGDYFNNEELQLWEMKNGYALADQKGLAYISNKIAGLNTHEYDYLKGKLKVGIQWDTEVTINENGQKVSQIYCSALPVAYSSVGSDHWEAFAQLILDATYEATILAGIINKRKTQNNKLFLTLVGGGAFGNKEEWIVKALKSNLMKYQYAGLDIQFVSYGQPSQAVEIILDKLKRE